MGKRFKLIARCGLSGILDRFYLLGPFNNDGRITSCQALTTDYLSAYGGEKRINASAFIKGAIPYVIGSGYIVNLIPITRVSGAIIYGLALLESPITQEVKIFLGSDDGYKLFVNDAAVGYLDEHRGLAPDSNQHRVLFKAGINRLLMKIENNHGGYEFTMRVAAPKEITQVFSLTEGGGFFNGYPKETIAFTDQGPRFTDFTRRLKYSGTDYFAEIAQRTEPEFTFKAKTKIELEQWQKGLKQKLRELLGPEPEREEKEPLVLYSEELEGGLTRDKVVIRAYRDSDIPAYLIRPTKPTGKYPCMLALHGHGPGAYPVAGVTFGEKYLRDGITLSNYDYGLQFAREGMVVLCPTARGFGERGMEGSHDCDTFGFRAALLGMNLLGLNLYDFMRSLDYLHRLPYVNPEKTGCVGLSLGGTFTLFLTPIEERIKVAVISGAVGSWRDENVWSCGSCGNQLFFGLLKYVDISDLLPLIAPQGLCVESGLYDSCFMWPGARIAHEKSLQAYRILGCSENLCIDAFPGPHIFHGIKSIPFVRDFLTRR